MTLRSEVYANDAGEMLVRCTTCGLILTGIEAGDDIQVIAERAAEHEEVHDV